MPQYANNITRLCELAFREYAQSIGLASTPAASIFAGFDDENSVTPRIVFNCDEADPEGTPDDGVWACTLEIQCTSNRDDHTPDRHHAFVSEVFSQFMSGRYTTVPNGVNSAAVLAGLNFSVMDIMPGRQAKKTDARSAYSSMAFKVICFGKAQS